MSDPEILLWSFGVTGVCLVVAVVCDLARRVWLRVDAWFGSKGVWRCG